MSAKHPAKFSDALLPVIARYVDGARTILDPFAGTGKVGLLRQHLTVPPVWILANELESEWATEAKGNGCDLVRVGDARAVGDWVIGAGVNGVQAIVVSPTYGNRMADSCEWAPGRKHSTYHGSLGRRPSTGSSAALQWGDAYRQLHREAWAEAWRVLTPGGRLVLNVADHYRDGQLQGVPEWHVSALLGLGFKLLDWTEVETPRYGFGANAELRAPELVICLKKPGVGVPFRPFERANPYRHLVDEPRGLWAVEPEPQQLGLFAGGGA